MRRRILGLALAWMVGVAAACGAADDASEPSNTGADDAGPTVDGAADAIANDAAATTDGRSDAATDSGLDASKVSPCLDASAHWLCDDFDRDGGTILAPWAKFNSSGIGSSVAFVTDPLATSTPNVLLAVGGAASEAEVARGTANTTPGFDCSFDMTVVQVGGMQARFARFVLQGSDAQGAWQYFVSLHSTGTELEVWENGIHGALIPVSKKSIPLPSGTTHVTTSIRLGATPKLVVAAGGTAVVTTPANDLTGLTMPTDVQTVLGIIGQPGSGLPWKVAYDNIVCDLASP